MVLYTTNIVKPVHPIRWINWLLTVLLVLHVSLPSAGHAAFHVDHPHAHASWVDQAPDINVEQSTDFHSHDHQHALALSNKAFCLQSLLRTEQRLTGYTDFLPSLLTHKIYKPPKNTPV